jgi:hypothetical protein
MEQRKLSLLETLPLLILETICGYLDDSSDRSTLWAFSSTSRQCCIAATSRRFYQIPLRVYDEDQLEAALTKWADILDLDDRRRCVRQLKVAGLKVTNNRNSNRRGDDEDDDWKAHHYFDFDDFCLPSDSGRRVVISKLSESWLSLARFISQLPALKDLVWACSDYMPPCVLSAVHDVGCRLHMHIFRLGSLSQSRNNQQPIDPDEYALATSPSLYSIVVTLTSFESGGNINYIREAVEHLLVGDMPNLAYLKTMAGTISGELEISQNIRLGKPPWAGLFPGTTSTTHKPEKKASFSSLQSLDMGGYLDLRKWVHHGSLDDLRHLTMSWDIQEATVLADIAIHGGLKSLVTLELSYDTWYGRLEDELVLQDALLQVLEHSNPLQRLDLNGYVSDKLFNTIVNRHGKSLHSLSLLPERNNESTNPLVLLSSVALQNLAEACPNLEQLQLWVNRTHGDSQEVGIYQALSRLPRLTCLHLRLWYTIGPDEDLWDEERDGEYPLSQIHDHHEIPVEYLRDGFSNGALDATLARAIFDLISSNNNLSYLRLEMSRKMKRYAPQSRSYGTFDGLLAWFNRRWICRRHLGGEVDGQVTIRDPDSERTVGAGLEWKSLNDGELYIDADIFKQVFQDVWPPRTSEWWNDWESLPLSIYSTE